VSGALDPVTSIKAKLGALVAASVVVAALLATLGSAAGVPALLTVPVAVALALGVTQLLAAGMVAPLRQMTDVAQRMARGDYSGRVRTTATDEVGRLAAAFNRMAADLEQVDAERRDLIATVSHELRTPLAAMTAVLENLADGVVPADPEHLAGALAQAERLRDLVADLLDLSRLEAGVIRLEPRDVVLAGLVADCVREVTHAGRTASYDVAITPDLVVTADPARLRQLLVNTLDNAGRHTPPGTPVHVTAGSTEDHWWLEVADHGPGVAPDDRERVFQRFGASTTGGGTGLGLAVARWVAQLHGGTLRFTDPTPDRAGARLRLQVPAMVPDEALVPVPARLPTSPVPPRVATPGPGHRTGSAAAEVPGPPGLDALFGAFWPEQPGSAAWRVVAASALVGVLAGATMTFVGPGLAWTLVLAAAGGAAYVTARHRRDPFVVGATALGLLLVVPLTVRDNAGIALLCVAAAIALFLVAVTRAVTLSGFLLAGLSWPLSALRGLPWFGRSVRLAGTGGRAPAVARTVALSLLGLLVFGALFASADALFASWVDAVVPNLTFGDLVVRGFVACAVFGLSLAGSYAALNPARVESPRRRAEALPNRFEWLVPVLMVDAVFVVFLAAQATVFFGGHDYLERTTGITYADHVHQGFGQLTVATALTLLVVWAAARRAGDDPADRLWLRLSLGLLCLLTLVVVASALYRMHVYQEAYGFTTLRLVVDVFEGWLGLVVLTVMVAGVLGLGRWVPRIALVTGAVATLGLAVLNPDAWVADRNIDRYEETGSLDLRYLESLSADAAPVVVERLPEQVAACVLRDLPDNQVREEDRSLWGWNLGRDRAVEALTEVDPPGSPDGSGDPCSPVYEEYGEPSGTPVG
jgi:two-component system, OmpR family, sensor histidine kinase BaeS